MARLPTASGATARLGSVCRNDHLHFRRHTVHAGQRVSRLGVTLYTLRNALPTACSTTRVRGVTVCGVCETRSVSVLIAWSAERDSDVRRTFCPRASAATPARSTLYGRPTRTNSRRARDATRRSPSACLCMSGAFLVSLLMIWMAETNGGDVPSTARESAAGRRWMAGGCTEDACVRATEGHGRWARRQHQREERARRGRRRRGQVREGGRRKGNTCVKGRRGARR